MTGTSTGAKFGIRTETDVTVSGTGRYSDVIRTGSGPTWMGYVEHTQYVLSPATIMVLTAYAFRVGFGLHGAPGQREGDNCSHGDGACERRSGGVRQADHLAPPCGAKTILTLRFNARPR